MIKRKVIKRKTLGEVLIEYVRTAFLSFLAALIFTTLLSIHARNEMIRNLYVSAEEQQKIDEKLALELVKKSDFMKDLQTKKYNVCMHVGNLYEAAQDYKKAELAYKLAASKANKGVYTPYLKLTTVLFAQEKFNEAEELLNSIKDVNNKKLIKFKSRAYIIAGDKYYSVGKFLSAAKAYEKADFYYSKFSKRDKTIEHSIEDRIVNAYIQTADIMVKNGYNSDAARFLKKAEKHAPQNYQIKYKLAIILSDLDPIQAVNYFEPLLEKIPQDIDYGAYSKTLMKAANIADWEGKAAQAKYYRYKIHSIDLFINQKVVYRNDIEIILDSFSVRKLWFKYRLKAVYRIKNVSNIDIPFIYADFVLKQGDKVLETVSVKYADKTAPLFSNGGISNEIKVTLGRSIYTKRELKQDSIDIYLYKDEKYKTLVSSMKIPEKTIRPLKN